MQTLHLEHKLAILQWGTRYGFYLVFIWLLSAFRHGMEPDEDGRWQHNVCDLVTYTVAVVSCVRRWTTCDCPKPTDYNRTSFESTCEGRWLFQQRLIVTTPRDKPDICTYLLFLIGNIGLKYFLKLDFDTNTKLNIFIINDINYMKLRKCIVFFVCTIENLIPPAIRSFSHFVINTNILSDVKRTLKILE